MPPAAAQPGIPPTVPFHGWRIAGAGAVLQALGPGLFGVYGFVASSIVAEFGASDAQVGFGMSISILGMTIASPVVGPVLDRGPFRSVMFGGIATMLLGVLSLASFGTALWQLALCYALASVGIALYGALPVQVLLIRWFVERRGTALAVAGAGFSVGSFAMPPLSAWLVESQGWRDAVVYIAIGAALINTLVTAWLVVPRPEDRGQIPDGRPPTRPQGDGATSDADISLREVAHDRNFWLIGLGSGMALSVPIATLFLVRHLESFGIAPGEASLVFVVMGVAGLIGKLVTGTLADRRDERAVTLLALSSLLVGWLGFSQVETLEGTLLAGLPAGFGAGGMIPMTAVLVGACFPRSMAGRVMGLQAGLGLPFMLSVSPLVGLARDLTGSFELSFLGLAGLVAIAIVLIGLLRIPPRESRG